MARICGLTVIVALSLPAWHSEAANLPTAVRQCVQQVEQQYGCTTACVNQTWPEVVRCANDQLTHPFSQDRLDVCIQRVQNARDAAQSCELCGDPVRSAFNCVGG
jgi:hypothetical protein